MKRVSPGATFTISPAAEEDIRWAASTARCVYSGLDIISAERMLEWFEANPTGFFIIKDGEGHRCGNFDSLPLRPDALARFLRGELIEREMRGDSLFRPYESNRIDCLYIESFVFLTKDGRGNPLAAYRCMMSLPDLVRGVCAPPQIKKLYAIGASQSGIRLMKHLGFEKMEYSNVRRDGHQVFSVSFPALVKNIAIHARGKDKLGLMRLLKEIEEEPLP